MTIAPQNSQNNYLPPEVVFDGDDRFLRENLSKRERLTATIINTKENANYELRELISAQQWFNPSTSQATSTGSTRQPRYGFRTTFDLVALHGGSIPGGGLTTTITLSSTTIPPLITFANSLIPTHIVGAATIPGPKYIPIPYASATGANVEVWFDNTIPSAQKIVIINGLSVSLSQCYLVFEYIKT
jgi:hypothetical protein